jgi:L-methionine (R)-S-oxide reductase
MAETITDLRDLPRPAAYAELKGQMELVLEGIDDPIAGMATLAALLHGGFGFLWVGFYRAAKPDELLRIGPYQGSLGCLEIPFGKGVCGTAASERRTVIVDDVSLFPGHITCDPRSRSEIVVPVFNRSGELIAVLDIDSDDTGAFSEDDRAGLEEIVQWFRKAA